MNVILAPVGSAGDVHPMVGLGLALKRRGHRITMVVNGYFQDLIERVGLEYVELGTKQEFMEFVANADLWHPTRSFPYIYNHGIAPTMRAQYDIIAQRQTAGDTMVISSCLGFGARIAHDKLGVPLATVHLQPAALWSEHESPVLPGMLLRPGTPRWLKRFQYWLGESIIIDRVIDKETNGFRRELGLSPVKRTTRWWNSPECIVCLFPAWYAPPQSDWPAQVVLTDFPLWDEREVTEVRDELERFLSSGDPPIVFTPGSAMFLGQSFFSAAAEACRRLGRRGLLLSRFRDHIPTKLPDGVRHFEYIPFSRVLPRAAALVHHGGIGSTSQALAAGIPQLVMPMAHDQPDNAARVARLGVGDWLKPSAFRPHAVADKLDCLLNSNDVRRSCQIVAAKLDRQGGLEKACVAIERFAIHGTSSD